MPRKLEVRDQSAVRQPFDETRPDVVIHVSYAKDGGSASAITGALNVASAASERGSRLSHISSEPLLWTRLRRVREVLGVEPPAIEVDVSTRLIPSAGRG